MEGPGKTPGVRVVYNTMRTTSSVGRALRACTATPGPSADCVVPGDAHINRRQSNDMRIWVHEEGSELQRAQQASEEAVVVVLNVFPIHQ